MYFNENTVLFLDGKWLKASETATSLYNQTLHYGNGVFEGIRSYETEHGPSIFKAKEHYERLLYSAEKMYIDIPYTVDELTAKTYKLLELNGIQDAYIRPLVYLGEDLHLNPSSDVHVLLAAWEWDKYLGDQLVDVMTSPFQRPNPKSCFVDAKVTGHYSNSILASTDAKRKGFDEALLLDMNGYVAEGPGANFFYEKDNKLYTCPTGNILPGITRATMFELCELLEIELEERFFTPEEIRGADGAFFVGTAAEVAGISSLDRVPFKLSWEDTIGFELSKAYKRKVLEQEPVYIF
ncbi:MAG: branched-chain amino acid transaminase [Aureispira sp.]|nr:branched-chain amino acid transaminase [Aureispira sp.]